MTAAERHELYVDFLVAHCSEEEIEERLSALMRRNRDEEALRQALRRVDALQANGTYEAEVAILRAKIEEETSYSAARDYLNSPEVQRGLARSFSLLQRMWDGLHSPDAEQRQRFEALFGTIEDKSIKEAKEILAVLEPTKKTAGRKHGRAFSGDAPLLREMKELVRNGSTVAGAARQVVAKTPNIGTLESRRKRLERAFRAKIGLR